MFLNGAKEPGTFQEVSGDHFSCIWLLKNLESTLKLAFMFTPHSQNELKRTRDYKNLERQKVCEFKVFRNVTEWGLVLVCDLFLLSPDKLWQGYYMIKKNYETEE